MDQEFLEALNQTIFEHLSEICSKDIQPKPAPEVKHKASWFLFVAISCSLLLAIAALIVVAYDWGRLNAVDQILKETGKEQEEALEIRKHALMRFWNKDRGYKPLENA